MVDIASVVGPSKRNFRFFDLARSPAALERPVLAQRFLSSHAAVYNAFNTPRHLVSARSHRVLRATAKTTWRGRGRSLTIRDDQLFLDLNSPT